MSAPDPRQTKHPGIRVACAGVGAGFLALGAAGIFLPLLPTTPFLLLAAFCFARASRRLDRWIHSHALIGPLLAEWRAHRAIPLNAKRVAYLMLAASLTASLLLIEDTFVRLMLAALYAVLTWILWRIPSRRVSGHAKMEF